LLGIRPVAPQRARSALVGTGRAPQRQVDAAGIKRLQRAELLRNDQRRVIRQHDAAGAHANPAGAAGQVADDDRSGGARDPLHVVMLGDPVARVAQALGVARELEGVAQCVRRRLALDDGREIENRKADHGVRKLAKVPDIVSG
jgi:hypothetical protein